MNRFRISIDVACFCLRGDVDLRFEPPVHKIFLSSAMTPIRDSFEKKK